MKVSFHTDFRKDLEGLLDIELGITGTQLTSLVNISESDKLQLRKALEGNNYNYDQLIIPTAVIDTYKPIFLHNKNILVKTRKILEQKWGVIEREFFRNVNSVFNLKVKIPLNCYVVYSYNSIGGVHTKGVFLVGYKASNVYTVAHEIIHIYLDELGVVKILNNRKELIEILARIIEYKVTPHKKIEFFPHWLKGLSPNQLQVLNSLETINLERATLKELISQLNQI